MNISEIIRVEMARQQLTDEALSEKSGVSRPIVADLRRGTAKGFKTKTLQKIADALDVTLELKIEPRKAARSP